MLQYQFIQIKRTVSVPFPTTSLPPKMLLLKPPQHAHSDGAKRKRKLKPNITSIPRRTNLPSYRTNKPHLRHTHYSTEDTKAECDDGGSARWKEGWGVPDGDVVLALFEDEVFG